MNLEERVAALETRVDKLERVRVDYIERSVDLCVNALREIACAQCPRSVVDAIDSQIAELRRHKTEPAPPPDENTVP